MKQQQEHPRNNTKGFRPTGRKHFSISFSLPNEVIEALNDKVGNTKGARSEYAAQVLAKALGVSLSY